MAEEVAKVFNRFDKNGDGKISATELAEVLKALGSTPSQADVKKMMKEIDVDGDGFVDVKEFAEFYLASGSKEELWEAFNMYDKNKNGLISASELHMVLKSLGDKCSVRECRKMIGSVDADGDGSVNFEEFKKMMGHGGSMPKPSSRC